MKKLFLIGLCLAFLSMSTMALAGEVFVTEHGKKYHKADCSLIKNKDVTAMDEKEAIEQGYEPCRRCLKDKYTKAKSEKQAVKTAKKSSRKSTSKKKK